MKRAANLSFAAEDDLLGVIEPGAPEDSYILERILEEDDEYRMPPPEHGPSLSEQEVERIRRWIAEGAQWSRHWAYAPPQRFNRPEVAGDAWSRQPVDYFVLEHLEKKGVQPTKDSPPARWLRRVSLDLIGLPPTLAERDAFLRALSTRGEEAYEEVVDRLLSSENFGERWASIWFDLVRYADSRGQSEDSPRTIWKYRDWVIDAFNRDLPYDEFTRKQIAGDLLPDRRIEDQLATAVHRLTASNEEGGTDDEEFRVAAIVDRVNTVWETWQGTSMGCVQCHDHPYDPIRHSEYYQSLAFFNNTADCDLTDDWPNLQVPLKSSDYDRATKLDREIHHLTKELWNAEWEATHNQAAWIGLRIGKAKTSNSTKVTVDSKADGDEYVTVGTIASRPTIQAELPLPKELKRVTGIRLTALPFDAKKALSDAEVGFVMSKIDVKLVDTASGEATEVSLAHAIGDEPFPYSDPAESFKDNKQGFGAYTRVHHPRHVVLIPEAPLDLQGESKLIVSIRYGIFDLAAFSLVAKRGAYAVTGDSILTELLEEDALKEKKAALDKLVAERADIPSSPTPILVERPAHLARPSHRFDRGLFLTKAELVKPGVPAALSSADRKIAGRAAFAEWLVSDENPLTARVAVNRFWSRMFGTGLVLTENDFGAAGDWPSHRALLDDLSVRFREDYGWSVKRLLREIALSSTYRQDSAASPSGYEQDPQNRLLSRGPRQLLPAETIRDQMLAVSGLLTTAVGGPPVHPPLPRGVWKVRRGKWPTAQVGDADRYRRSVYTYVKRSVPFPMFTSFDAPPRDICTSMRLRSNTPIQSLMLLNDAGAHESASAFAALMKDSAASLEQQVRHGFLRATCREPDEVETQRLMTLYNETAAAASEEVAMQTVAAVLLNLDEVLNN